jgi:hypothetical protein
MTIDAATCKPRSLGDSLDYGIAVEGLCASAERASRASPADSQSGEGPSDFPDL